MLPSVLAKGKKAQLIGANCFATSHKTALKIWHFFHK
jgi:hypothetical protein